jgi:5-hydroxyisourate hydrolase-like protein (transthyretin family)
MPPGEYEFKATATDVAGNQSETTRRGDGTAMVLSFPLREPVQLSAGLPGGSKRQTIPYRKGSRASGTLVDASGTPLVGHQVTVEEFFGAGALIDRRIRTVTTDEDGRWTSKLPAGPSRRVTATFEGSQRYRPMKANGGLLRVRSKASFGISRSRVPEGGRVLFSGRVGHKAARIPTGGKLIELQVRESAGRWNTVREAFYTKSSGRFRLGYRFGKFYETNATFRFRLKVVHEQGWPYKAPVRSRPRAVTVVAK